MAAERFTFKRAVAAVASSRLPVYLVYVGEVHIGSIRKAPSAYEPQGYLAHWRLADDWDSSTALGPAPSRKEAAHLIVARLKESAHGRALLEQAETF